MERKREGVRDGERKNEKERERKEEKRDREIYIEREEVVRQYRKSWKNSIFF